MKPSTLRLPDELDAPLRRAAMQGRRSLNGQVVAYIEAGLLRDGIKVKKVNGERKGQR